jgi:hypothetical protein
MYRTTNTECYCGSCDGLGSVIKGGINTKCYCVFCESVEGVHGEKLIQNFSVFVVSVRLAGNIKRN